MTFRKGFMACLGCCLLAGIVSCSKSDDKKDATASLSEIAKSAMNEASPEEETRAVQAMIQEAGFVMKSYGDFPAEELGKKGRMLIYTDKRGKSSGGIIYFRKTGSMVTPAWHWYFGDMVPESVAKVELNDDGLWDLRILSKGGQQLEYLQDQSFLFTGADRSDWIAMNGTCSAPLTDEDALWKCFDSDTSTAWRSSISANGQVFVELSAPFGVKEGVLNVHTLDVQQPQQCTLYADGKKLQVLELTTDARQMITLNDGVKGARTVRLTFDTIRGGGDVVSVAELALK